jgi:hypothetical protein
MNLRARAGLLMALNCVIFLLSSTTCLAAPPEKMEKQSAFATSNQQEEIISSSALYKLINTKLKGLYQDLQLVFSVCNSGEFAARAKADGLQGQWSVATSSDVNNRTTLRERKKAMDEAEKSGLKIGNAYFFGYLPQYIKELATKGNTAGSQALHEAAKAANSFPKENPQYEASLANEGAAKQSTVHSGKTSNHAILFTAINDKLDQKNEISNERINLITSQLYSTLTAKNVGYKPGEIDNLYGFNAPQKPVTRTATLDSLGNALDAISGDIQKNQNQEKVFLTVVAHGNYQDRTVAYRDGQLNQAGQGLLLTSAAPTLGVLANDPLLIHDLEVDLPKPGGGFFVDDPLLFRSGQPYLQFGTYRENFPGKTNVGVLLDNQFVGTLSMGNTLGADYLLPIPDPVLGSIIGDMERTGQVNLSFAFPDRSDTIQLAVTEDFMASDFTHLDYGVSIGTVLDTVDPAPEPGALGLALLGCLALLCRGWLRRHCLLPSRETWKTNYGK